MSKVHDMLRDGCYGRYMRAIHTLHQRGHDNAELDSAAAHDKRDGARSRSATAVRTISDPGALRALLQRVGILGRWHDLGDLDMSVRVLGSVFSCDGYPVGSVPQYPEVEELTVCFYREDVYVGAILLADLCRLAASAPDTTPAHVSSPLPLGRVAS